MADRAGRPFTKQRQGVDKGRGYDKRAGKGRGRGGGGGSFMLE